MVYLPHCAGCSYREAPSSSHPHFIPTPSSLRNWQDSENYEHNYCLTAQKLFRHLHQIWPGQLSLQMFSLSPETFIYASKIFSGVTQISAITLTLFDFVQLHIHEHTYWDTSRDIHVWHRGVLRWYRIRTRSYIGGVVLPTRLRTAGYHQYIPG